MSEYNGKYVCNAKKKILFLKLLTVLLQSVLSYRTVEETIEFFQLYISLQHKGLMSYFLYNVIP